MTNNIVQLLMPPSGHFLPFIVSPLEKDYRGQHDQGDKQTQCPCGHHGQSVNPQSEEARDDSREVKSEDGAALAETGIGQAVRGVVLAWGSEGNEAPAHP